MPTYPLYTAVIAKLGARAVYYRTDPSQRWMPDLDHLAQLVTPATRAIVVIDPNNPTGVRYSDSVRKALIEFADHHGLAILADEVYGDLGYDGPVAPLGALAPDAPIMSFSSLSKGFSRRAGAPAGWRSGALRASTTCGGGEEAGGRPPVQHRSDAVRGRRGARPATGRTRRTFRAALKERATVTTRALRAMPGVTCMAPRRRST